MCLFFQLPRNGKVILHVGDFRACPDMEEYPELWNNKIDQLYLDTTYCKPEYDFPSQQSVIKATVDLVKNHLVKYPRILICAGSYTIGKFFIKPEGEPSLKVSFKLFLSNLFLFLIMTYRILTS